MIFCKIFSKFGEIDKKPKAGEKKRKVRADEV